MRNYLIVDDNREFAENVAEILEDGPDRGWVAGSGAEALALVGERRFDAVLTDMRMPIMGGAELVHRLRRIDAGLPAIAITAYTGDDQIAAARREGLLAVLPKPVVVPHLLDLLRKARRHGLVALVEDDLALADNLGEVLRARGFSVITATSVLETERLGAVRPFSALVDLRVRGGADGEALTKLAAKYPGLPMIVITAHGELELPIACAALILKPFETARVLDVLEELHRAALEATGAGAGEGRS